MTSNDSNKKGSNNIIDFFKGSKNILFNNKNKPITSKHIIALAVSEILSVGPLSAVYKTFQKINSRKEEINLLKQNVDNMLPTDRATFAINRDEIIKNHKERSIKDTIYHTIIAGLGFGISYAATEFIINSGKLKGDTTDKKLTVVNKKGVKR